MLLAVASPGAVAQGPKLTMHPSGFGERSYAAWRGQEGLPDARGNADAALYLQKMTTTTTFAAAVVVFEGVGGLSTAAIMPLGFSFRVEGHCGAGAPRFNVTFQPAAGGPLETLFFGCNSNMMSAGTTTDAKGRTWEKRTATGPLPPGTVLLLVIVYDEGIEFPPGFVFLDDIRVGSKTWTSPADNGQ